MTEHHDTQTADGFADGSNADVTRSDDTDGSDDDHLADLPDGSGCTEIWEHLSERRSESDD